MHYKKVKLVTRLAFCSRSLARANSIPAARAQRSRQFAGLAIPNRRQPAGTDGKWIAFRVYAAGRAGLQMERGNHLVFVEPVATLFADAPLPRGSGNSLRRAPCEVYSASKWSPRVFPGTRGTPIRPPFHGYCSRKSRPRVPISAR